MAQMLCRDLSVTDRALLTNMTYHEGFKVLIKMMDECCENATNAVIKLDPISTDNYEKKLALLQLTARATNDFCASLLKSIEAQRRAVLDQAKQEQEENELFSRLMEAKNELIRQSQSIN